MICPPSHVKPPPSAPQLASTQHAPNGKVIRHALTPTASKNPKHLNSLSEHESHTIRKGNLANPATNQMGQCKPRAKPTTADTLPICNWGRPEHPLNTQIDPNHLQAARHDANQQHPTAHNWTDSAMRQRLTQRLRPQAHQANKARTPQHTTGVNAGRWRSQQPGQAALAPTGQAALAATQQKTDN